MEIIFRMEKVEGKNGEHEIQDRLTFFHSLRKCDKDLYFPEDYWKLAFVYLVRGIECVGNSRDLQNLKLLRELWIESE